MKHPENPPFRPGVCDNFPESLNLLMTECWSECPDNRPHFDVIAKRFKTIFRYRDTFGFEWSVARGNSKQKWYFGCFGILSEFILKNYSKTDSKLILLVILIDLVHLRRRKWKMVKGGYSSKNVLLAHFQCLPFQKSWQRGLMKIFSRNYEIFSSNQDISSCALNYIFFSYLKWRHDFIILLYSAMVW